MGEKYEVLRRIEMSLDYDDRFGELVLVYDLFNVLSKIEEFLLEGLELRWIRGESKDVIEVRRMIKKEKAKPHEML